MQGLSLLQRGSQRAVQAILQIQLSAPQHDVGKQIAEERRILFQQGLQVEHPLGRHEFVQANLLWGDGSPLLVAVLGVWPRITHAFEDHPTILT